MTDKPTKTLEEVLIENLYELKSTRDSLIANGLDVPEPQTVMIPIPNVLVVDKDPNVCRFIEKLGFINRETSLGLQVAIQEGVPVKLTDGRTSAMLELVFMYNEGTDIEGVKAFLDQ